MLLDVARWAEAGTHETILSLHKRLTVAQLGGQHRRTPAREELRSLAKEAEGVAASVGWGRRRGRHFSQPIGIRLGADESGGHRVLQDLRKRHVYSSSSSATPRGCPWPHKRARLDSAAAHGRSAGARRLLLRRWPRRPRQNEVSPRPSQHAAAPRLPGRWSEATRAIEEHSAQARTHAAQLSAVWVCVGVRMRWCMAPQAQHSLARSRLRPAESAHMVGLHHGVEQREAGRGVERRVKVQGPGLRNSASKKRVSLRAPAQIACF